MKLKIVEFNSQEEFENSDVVGQDNVAVIIRENGVLKFDVMLTMKYLKRALDKLLVELKDYPDIAAFIEGFIEEYKDYGRISNYSGANDIKNGCWAYSYGVEQFDNAIYVFVNQKIWEE